LKKLLFISLAAVLALSVGLIGCAGGGVKYDLIIASSAGGSTTPAARTYSYAQGKVVALVATPDEYYHFVNWTGDVGTVADVNAATTTIIMNGDYSITANFELEPWDYTIRLNFHCTVPPSVGLVQKVYLPWAQAVENATGPDGGKFKFNFTYGDTPYNDQDSLMALSTGVVDLGQLSGETFHLGSIGYLPFLWDMAEAAYATYNLLATEVGDWDALGELDDVKVLLASPLQPTEWWGNVRVTTLADLAGVRIRAEAGEVPTIEALGATPVTGIEIGDLAGNLLAGLVDGYFYGYPGGIRLGLCEVTQYNTEVNLFTRVFVLAMNREVYEGLHPDARALLDTFCTAEKSVKLAKAYEAGQADGKFGLNNYRASHGQSPIYVLPEAELDNWKDACASVYTAWIANMTALGFDGQGFYDRALELIAEYEAS
jgi:TRAP-type C4-dicarboxylate transport system substrate-binding protein